jgi:predicted PurR-regulated permease PerM
MRPARPTLPLATVPAFPWAALTTAVVLVGVLLAHLLTALLAGLLVHQLIHRLANRWRGVTSERARLLAVALLGALVITGVTLAILGLLAFLDGGQGLSGMVATLGDVLGRMRTALPAWAGRWVPLPEAFQGEALMWLQHHSASLQTLGRHTLEGIVRLLIGMVLGALIALAEQHREHDQHPLPLRIGQQARAVALAFDRVVFAQVKISAVNTGLTALFLFVALPLAGHPIPFAKTLVVLTFLMGLLPVAGNLISNTAIVLVALSVSPNLAAVALIFLVLVHKLEYFLNARIVGGEIEAKAWEILLAMVVMEALFGLPGVVLAPIAYAYLKQELKRTGWV